MQACQPQKPFSCNKQSTQWELLRVAVAVAVVVVVSVLAVVAVVAVVVVVVVVVVVLTVCIDDVSVHATKRQASNCWGRVPVDTTPCTCVQGPKKSPLTVRALQLLNRRSFLHSEPPDKCRCTQRACERPCPSKNTTSATVGSRLSSPQQHMRVCRATQQGHRPPCKKH